MERRPVFRTDMSGCDFDQWYWSKEELDKICKQLSIPANARKNELRRRIIQFLEEGEVTISHIAINSDFDWAKEELKLNTVITDSIKFGQNLRRFMKKHTGDDFSFSGAFMAWVKENKGKTLEDAIDYWFTLKEKTKNGFRMDMSDFNVMNKYLEDFLNDNPQLKRDDGMKCWQLKKYYPAPKGLVRYEPQDLGLLS